MHDAHVMQDLFNAPAVELPEVQAGRLPARYGYAMQSVFFDHVRPLLKPGIAILDVGAGRNPIIAPDRRPAGCRYVGLDVSEEEMLCAPPGAYDMTIVHDITSALVLEEQFDLVLSWQVLEHVKPIEQALDNLKGLLRPGGTMIAQLSGSFSAFAVLARIVPHRARVWAMARFLGHPEEMKFRTYYDHCWATALETMLASWSAVTLLPYYRGAVYFGMSRPLQVLYLTYESIVADRDVRNLATHYLVIAQR